MLADVALLVLHIQREVAAHLALLHELGHGDRDGADEVAADHVLVADLDVEGGVVEEDALDDDAVRELPDGVEGVADDGGGGDLVLGDLADDVRVALAHLVALHELGRFLDVEVENAMDGLVLVVLDIELLHACRRSLLRNVLDLEIDGSNVLIAFLLVLVLLILMRLRLELVRLLDRLLVDNVLQRDVDLPIERRQKELLVPHRKGKHLGVLDLPV
mmetsp:Transcript_4458/g.11540  ORF Transcript_4458/g.11540 Transcript_4458/m.11540 type:complete len:217 (-) Transcript_4458:263-913(-)